jgi:C4-dicarboxylate-specific signal transduction histidine kinase
MENSPRRLLLASGLAIALVAAALALTLLLHSFVSTAGYVFFYAAVLASAWFGGKWSGSLAVILSGLTVAYFFTPPVYSFLISRDSLPLFIEFAGSAIIVAWFSSWRKRAEIELRQARDELQFRVEERTAELRHTNQQLHAEMDERKRVEDAYYEARRELSRLNRISAMGALAASISHEINQPLAAVVTNADACSIWLTADPPNLDEARRTIDCIAREGTRASDVVRRIRAMFTKGAPEISQVQINSLILEVGGLLASELFHNRVELQTDLAGDLPPALGDAIQLRQVLVNLAVNAIEAMSAVVDRPRMLLIRSGMKGADELLIAVEDSGPGIVPQDRPRIFEAFFTTKSKGTGMGLSISQSIIESHGGRLWASPNAQYGMTFQFTLPAGRTERS